MCKCVLHWPLSVELFYNHILLYSFFHQYLVTLYINIIFRSALFYVPPIVCGGYVLDFVLVCITSCPFKFFNHLDSEESWVLCFYCLLDAVLL